jgi:hypothetical protein
MRYKNDDDCKLHGARVVILYLKYPMGQILRLFYCAVSTAWNLEVNMDGSK